MFLHFFYVDYKKEKKNFICIIKSKTDNELNFQDINNILYENLNNDAKPKSNFNCFEYFYIKRGLIIENQKYIWDKLMKIYLKKINILNLIDNKYISNLYDKNILLLDYGIYKFNLIDFLIEHYSEKYREDNLNNLIQE
jgi:hypothetical protein